MQIKLTNSLDEKSYDKSNTKVEDNNEFGVKKVSSEIQNKTASKGLPQN